MFDDFSNVTRESRRQGLEAAKLFHEAILPLLEVHWVEEELHATGAELMFRIGKRSAKLTDCVSFVLMQQLDLKHAFAFDPDFERQGFRTL